MHDEDANDPVPVRPGEVDLAAIDAFINEYPWSYHEVPPKAVSGARVQALTMSRNKVLLHGSPEIESNLLLKIELSPGDTPIVVLSLHNGRPDCDVLEGCDLTVTLDTSQVEIFHAEMATMPTQDFATDLIISEPQRFIALIRSSKSAAIALPLGGNGMKSFSFVTHGLRWPPSVADT